MTRRHVLVARPTTSGVDVPAVAALAAACGLGYALLDQGEPTIHDALDDAAAADLAVTLIPLAVPRDRYLETWIARAVANWRETRTTDLDIRVTEGLDSTTEFADLLRARLQDDGTPVTASPRAFRSPAWSEIPEHTQHILVCRGPRCTVYGAADLHRTLRHDHPDALITTTGCLSPCNLGPLYVTYPDGEWHTATTALALEGAAGPD
ncbi:(2Fe-2S) ferredoxin domain-containing protein [Nocardia asteroides]|uniref:(2Fe-2S) ferredoxin domain-containing protein n=1 Tax=Nocardia asteroides TaxID=1824 RepID=UPI001E51338B|nr:(2Fe-2S) ferredoxin domain-containing protein [Nocardia asteroides]UGT55652.1 (2Fe-2S) ferredoxin domain-containing protein [Nocardia asteroides]